MRYIVYFTADEYVSIEADSFEMNGEYVDFAKDAKLVATFRLNAVLGWEIKEK
jgi:hypothetical protein